MLEDKIEDPLVSVGVLTYNSAKTVLETLESIKAQTYKNIELIISDDASKDNTVEICKKWIDENKDRFVRCEVLTVPENTGIPANANRRIMASNGIWCKGIAADDVLLPDCIENFINYVNENPEAEIVFARLQPFKNVLDEKNFMQEGDYGAKWFCENLDTPEKQYHHLLNDFYCHASTMFAKLSLVRSVKYDEDLRIIEDYPMWLRLTKVGVRFFYMDKIVAYYRISNASTCGNNGTLRTKLVFRLGLEPFRRKYIYPNKPFYYRFFSNMRYHQLMLLKKFGLLEPSNGKFKDVLLSFFYYAMSPHLIILKKFVK